MHFGDSTRYPARPLQFFAALLCLVVPLVSGCLEDTVIDSGSQHGQLEDAGTDAPDIGETDDARLDGGEAEDASVEPECSSAADCADGEVCAHGSCVSDGKLRITLSWSAQTDLDLYVRTPSGEMLSYSQPQGSHGGRMSEDACPICGEAAPFVESAAWLDEPPSGTYEIWVENASADEPADFDIEIVYDGQTERHSQQVEASADTSSEVVQFTIEAPEIFRFLTPQDGERLRPDITFKVDTNIDEIDRVEYFADDWSLGESRDAASNYEVSYSFQYPGEDRIIDARAFDSAGAEIAADRVTVTVTNEAGRLPGECSVGSSDGNDAQCILDHHHADTIYLLPQQVSGVQDDADALDNIRDAANGSQVKNSCYGNAPCGMTDLSLYMLDAIVTMIEDSGYSFRVTSIAGGSHSANSYHYIGRAFDVDKVNGIKINGDSQIARQFMNLCRDLGANNVLGPSNHTGHQTHIHCRW